MMDLKRNVLMTFAAILIFALSSFAGPVEFGTAELQNALAQRGLSPIAVSLETKIVAGKPECFTISGSSISASDERGLMYGLLGRPIRSVPTAACQIRLIARRS